MTLRRSASHRGQVPSPAALSAETAPSALPGAAYPGPMTVNDAGTAVLEVAAQARAASHELALATRATKDAALQAELNA